LKSFLDAPRLRDGYKMCSKIIFMEDVKLLGKICYTLGENNKSVIFDYNIFKEEGKQIKSSNVIDFFVIQIKRCLQQNQKFTMHIFIRKMYIIEIDENKNFYIAMVKRLRKEFDNKLDKCYIHNAPHFFSCLIDILKPFLNSRILSRIEIINHKKKKGNFSYT
jgi:hypothetical protein